MSALWALCKSNPNYIFVFFAAAVFKMQEVFTTDFLTLWYISFEDDGTIEEDESAELYQEMFIYACCASLIAVPLIGIIGDRFRSTIMIPLAFVWRAVSLCLFPLVTTPESPLATFVIILTVVGTTLEIVSVCLLLYRDMPNKLRGVLIGGMSVGGHMGKLIFAGIGGWMFDELGRCAPQLFMAYCDIFMFLLAIIFIQQGYIKNK